MIQYFPNIHISIQIAQPTPPQTKVQHHKTWNILLDPSFPIYPTHPPQPFPTYTVALPLKFPPEYSYYIDGSFYPPKQIAPNRWKPETASYGVYNPIKDIQISERFPGLQSILRAELMAIYTVIKLSITSYIDEPIYIFTDSLNSLYLINTHI
jgi:hypothetical protein